MTSPDEMSFVAATKARRSKRALEATSPVPDKDIISLVQTTLLDVPSAFNSQTTRISVLLHNDHKRLWEITGEALLAEIGDKLYNTRNGQMPSTKEKIENFKKAYGSILFWDDLQAIRKFTDEAPAIYKDKCEEWAIQSNGMHQYHIWTALATYGLGANLQHYNPLIDERVRKSWNLPKEWALKAQMVFGTPVVGAPLPDKVQKLPVDQRLDVFGANIKMPIQNGA